jgi:beta-glucanase (GH16 family)
LLSAQTRGAGANRVARFALCFHFDSRIRELRSLPKPLLAFPPSCTLVLALVAATLGGCSNPPEAEVETWTAPAAGWQEVWRDDFDTPAGTAPDAKHWNVEIRPSGYNEELDYDTDDRKNSFTDGSGNLVIRAIKENYVDPQGVKSSQPFTSARLNTQGKVEQAYGKFEARIKLPAGGKGVWPAFWMLGNDIDEVGWPLCGEVDILEMRGSRPSVIDGSLHGPGYSGGSAYHHYYELPSGNYGDAFHVFTFEWTPEGARWLVDGNEYQVKTAATIKQGGRRWVYDHPFFIIINLAIGGIYDGDPDSSTVFPQQMLVDYVSVSKLGGT